MRKPTNVLVYSERPEIVPELLYLGRTLADEVSGDLVGIALGVDAEGAAAEQVAGGADKVLIADDPRFDPPWARAHAAAVGEAVRRVSPGVVIVGATVHGVEVAARVAQRFGVACASECSTVRPLDGGFFVERGVLGRFVARQLIKSRPAIVTIPLRRFPAPDRDERRSGVVEALTVAVPDARPRTVRVQARERSDRRIEDADVVVAVGRGLRAKEDLHLARELADVVGGVVAASRPLTDDLQWLPIDVKVGLSGQKVKPDLYVACGISGQIEHNVGMRESRIVVAVNTDPTAPIVEQADYFVVGDLYDVLPRLTEALREVLR